MIVSRTWPDTDEFQDVAFQARQAVLEKEPPIDKGRHAHRHDEVRRLAFQGQRCQRARASGQRMPLIASMITSIDTKRLSHKAPRRSPITVRTGIAIIDAAKIAQSTVCSALIPRSDRAPLTYPVPIAAVPLP